MRISSIFYWFFERYVSIRNASHFLEGKLNFFSTCAMRISKIYLRSLYGLKNVSTHYLVITCEAFQLVQF